jgi:hypothetical protein
MDLVTSHYQQLRALEPRRKLNRRLLLGTLLIMIGAACMFGMVALLSGSTVLYPLILGGIAGSTLMGGMIAFHDSRLDGGADVV